MVRIAALFAVATAEMSWEEYKAEYMPAINGDDEERRSIYEATVAFIEEHNAKDLGSKLGVNQFSAWTAEEYKALLGYKSELRSGQISLGVHEWDGEELADSVDWTTQGAVTPVKNQGQCGSCWAFSTTGSLEGAWKLAGNDLTSFSEQQLVDCDKTDHGCQGGLMDQGFSFIEGNGICSEEDYPYTSATGSTSGGCKATCTDVIPKGGVSGHQDVKGDEQSLMSAVSKGPVSVAIEADKPVFQSYKSGILSGASCGTQLDHGVLVVGYGEDGGKKYWKVKNSWGTTWGEDGYLRIERGSGDKGTCGILSGPPSYPVIKTSSEVAV